MRERRPNPSLRRARRQAELTLEEVATALQVISMAVAALLSRAFASRAAPSFRTGLRTAATAVGHLPGALEVTTHYLAQEARSASPRRLEAALSTLAHPACSAQIPGEDALFAAIRHSERWLPMSTRLGRRGLVARLSMAPAIFSEQHARKVLAAPDLDRILDTGLLEVVGENWSQLHLVMVLSARLQRASGDDRESFADGQGTHACKKGASL